MKFRLLAICAMIGVGVIAGCSALEKGFAEAFKVQPDYYTHIKTTAPIESKYTQMGNLTVASQVFPSNQAHFKEFKVWYPTDITQAGKSYPVIVSANGTGFPYQKYEPVLARLASFGFVVIGNDDGTSWSGLSSSQSLALLTQLNSDKNSIFFNKLNINKAGIIGHSQGGVGAINGATNFNNSHQFKAIFTASTTKHDLARALKWDYDIKKVRVPYFEVSGVGIVDAGKANETNGGIAPLLSLRNNFNQIASNQLTVSARRKDSDHGDMLYKGDGYMTAWFLYHLKNDVQAGKMLDEIKHNANWQDVAIKH